MCKENESTSLERTSGVGLRLSLCDIAEIQGCLPDSWVVILVYSSEI